MAIGPEFVVLDTSVVSILYNKADAARCAYYQERLAGRRGLISFQTLEELLFGLHSSGWGVARTLRFREHIDKYEVVWLEPESNLVAIAARLHSDLQRMGRTLDVADAWIAATALMRQCPLASDDRDFVGIPGLPLIQPR